MIQTTNSFYTLEFVGVTDKPYFDGMKWNNLHLLTGEDKIYLSETRAALLGIPVKNNEEPSAYVRSIYGHQEKSYYPVFDRTYKVEYEKLYPVEVASLIEL